MATKPRSSFLGIVAVVLAGIALLFGGAGEQVKSLLGGPSTSSTQAIVEAAGFTTTGNNIAGCYQATATSSATQIKLVFAAAGATSTYAGTAYWQYGTCP